MKFLQGLYIALWSLLLVIPGIVKTYSYAYSHTGSIPVAGIGLPTNE